MAFSKKVILLFAVSSLLGAVLLASMFGLGIYYERSKTTVAATTDDRVLFSRERVEKFVDENLDTAWMRKLHENISSRSSLTGTPGDLRLAKELQQLWLAAGIDDVRIMAYDVYVSFPNSTNPSRMVAFDDQGNAIYNDTFEERHFDQSEKQYLSEVEPPYIAYGKTGTVEGDLVYANLCDKASLAELQRRKVNLTKAIVICRDGAQPTCPRNLKKIMAAANISAGICFNDPRVVAPQGQANVYPNGPYMPGDASMRYPAMSQLGDILTPFAPSVPYVVRNTTNLELEKQKSSLIIFSIGYDYALALISHTNLSQVDESWWEPVDTDVNYNMKPQQKQIAKRFRLSITTVNTVRPIYNVMGFVNGWEEPQRYVIFGNHKDSFHYGAIDSKSSTAVMCQSVRLFGTLLKKHNWRPRRTVVFAAWSGEELGLLGSFEFVDEFWKILQDRTIAYVNTDVAVLGNGKFQASGTSIFEDLLFDVTKTVSNPLINDSSNTVYDSWLKNDPDSDSYADRTIPKLHRGLGGTDYYAFYPRGIPFMEMLFTNSENPEFAPYHTGYDTHRYMIKFVDSNFTLHAASAKIYTKILMRLSSDPILPLSIRPYANALRQAYKLLSEGIEAKGLTEKHASGMMHLENAIANFSAVAEKFASQVDNIKKEEQTSFLTRLTINEKLMRIDRSLATVLSYGSDYGNKFKNQNVWLFSDQKLTDDAYTETIWNIRSAIANIHDLHFESMIH